MEMSNAIRMATLTQIYSPAPTQAGQSFFRPVTAVVKCPPPRTRLVWTTEVFDWQESNAFVLNPGTKILFAPPGSVPVARDSDGLIWRRLVPKP